MTTETAPTTFMDWYAHVNSECVRLGVATPLYGEAREAYALGKSSAEWSRVTKLRAALHDEGDRFLIDGNDDIASLLRGIAEEMDDDDILHLAAALKTEAA